jgi:6-phosphofructokinase 1
VKFLLGSESAKYGAVISIVGGKLMPLPFDSIIDPATSRMRPRKVDIDSVTYECARQYMIRLEKDDFANPAKLKKLADAISVSPEKFAERFGYLVK